MADSTQNWIKEIQDDAYRLTMQRIEDDKKNQARQDKATEAEVQQKASDDKKRA